MGPRGEAKADILQSRDQSSFRLWKVNRTEKRDFYANVISITFWSLPDFWGKKPSKLEVAPNVLKMLDGVGEWMDGYPLDCYDY